MSLWRVCVKKMTSGGPRLRVGVIGYGHVGRHHARILSELPDIDLAWVVDIDRQRAQQGAAAVGANAAFDAREIVGDVDAVNVAVPTQAHLEVALPFLERGVSVLVEKPLAGSLVEADRMIAAAVASGATFGVGHTERFNPAVAAAIPLIAAPKFIEVHRLGTFPERSLDIDVVFDVMIHDLDVVLSIVDSEVASIEAVGVAVLTDRVDIANVRLKFASGCIANLTASRISRDQVRKIRWFQHDAYVSIDYATQVVEQWRLVRQNGRPPEIEGGKVEVVQEEPLKLELLDFFSAVRHRRAPTVDGAAGRRALALAQQIAETITTESS
jgi:predicted dehydrogenase